MAGRVTWRCGFPGCGVITIGPKMGDHDKSLNLGEAAHIHATSPKGPRYDKSMISDERKAISMDFGCADHMQLLLTLSINIHQKFTRNIKNMEDQGGRSSIRKFKIPRTIHFRR